MLLVSDEVICAFGRLGHYFGSDRYGYQPDIITCAKGMTSGYSPIGAMIVSDRLVEPFLHGDNMFAHGYTFGGHPVSAAVALANLDIFEREELNEHVLDNEADVPARRWRSCTDLPIVGDVRGDGFFYGIELVKDKDTRETFDDDESERLLRGFLSKALFDAGLYCRADDRGDPVIQLVAAADLRPVALRRDGADPAQRADRGVVAALSSTEDRTRVRRLPEKQVTDRAVLDAVLDAARVAHVAVLDEAARPYVVPVGYARDGDVVLFHGSTGSRLFRGLAAGAPTCLTVTLLDGLVVARSTFESSMHYRSAMVLGVATRVPDDDKLRGARGAHRAPPARPVGGRPAPERQGARRRRWCSPCPSTSGR